MEEGNESSFCCIRLPRRRRQKKRAEGRFHCVIILWGKQVRFHSLILFNRSFSDFRKIYIIFSDFGIVYGQTYSYW